MNDPSNAQATLFAETAGLDSDEGTIFVNVVTVEWSPDGQWQHSADASNRYLSAIAAMRAVEETYGKRSWHRAGTTTYEGRLNET